MNPSQEKKNSLEQCGNFSGYLGISRTMARIHGMLLIAEGAISVAEISEQLCMSPVNARQNLKSLAVRGLVEQRAAGADGQEIFFAPKCTWTIARQVALERRRRELPQVFRVLEEPRRKKGRDSALAKFLDVVAFLENFTRGMTAILEKVSAKRRLIMGKICNRCR